MRACVGSSVRGSNPQECGQHPPIRKYFMSASSLYHRVQTDDVDPRFFLPLWRKDTDWVFTRQGHERSQPDDPYLLPFMALFPQDPQGEAARDRRSVPHHHREPVGETFTVPLPGLLSVSRVSCVGDTLLSSPDLKTKNLKIPTTPLSVGEGDERTDEG